MARKRKPFASGMRLSPRTFLLARLRLWPRSCHRTTPRRRSTPPGGLLRARALGRGDARNIDDTGIQHASKRRLSASWQQCGVVEGASVSWNSQSGRRASPRSPGAICFFRVVDCQPIRRGRTRRVHPPAARRLADGFKRHRLSPGEFAPGSFLIDQLCRHYFE